MSGLVRIFVNTTASPWFIAANPANPATMVHRILLI